MSQLTLEVWRQLDDKKILMGTLGENQHSVLFQYDTKFLNTQLNPSPFLLPFDDRIHRFSKTRAGYLPGLFTDSLSQHWGLRPLMDFFRGSEQPQVSQANCHDLLAEESPLGALRYTCDTTQASDSTKTDLYQQLRQQYSLSQPVQTLLESDRYIHGMPWQAQVFIDPLIPDQLHTEAAPHLQPWALRFSNPDNPLGQEQGLADAAWLQMAELAGIDIPQWQLITPPAQSKAAPWLAFLRPDYGQQHTQRLSSLLDNPWWQPGAGYQQLIRASQLLCNRPAVGRDMFVRAMFNLLSCNQDDHSKHWSFTQDSHGNWQPAPMYNASFSPASQHAMPFGAEINRKTIQQLASLANYSHWKHARQVIEEVMDALQNWEIFASQLDISRPTIHKVRQQLDSCYQRHRGLLQN